MNAKLITFVAIFPIVLSLLNTVPVIQSIIHFAGYLGAVSVIVWEITNRLIHAFNTYGFGKVNPSKKIVIVTGCDSGFGYLSAKRLNEYGFTVIATCLLPDGSGAKQLKAEVKNPQQLAIVGCDVTKQNDIENVYQKLQELIKNGSELWGIVNNPGIAVSAEAEWGTFENNFSKVFDVNCFGVVKVTRKFLPLIRRANGRIVIVSSSLGRNAHPKLVAYSMTKAATISFTDGLRQSMEKFGVEVCCIEPFAYKTPIFDIEKFQIRKLWNETDASIQRDYGEQHLQDVIKINENMGNNVANKNPIEVADAITEALTAPYPNKRQICGIFVPRLICSILSIIPIDFTFEIFRVTEKSLK